MLTVTTQHNWVKHVITPVSVLTDADGDPVVIVDPDQQVVAEDNAAYGCSRCQEAMATHFGEPCTPEEND